MYERILKKLREEADTPVEAVLPEGRGLVGKKQAPVEEKTEESPYSNMKDWMTSIRSNGRASRGASESLMRTALTSPISTGLTKKTSPAAETSSPPNKKKSAFDLDISGISPRDKGSNGIPFNLEVGDETLSLIRGYEGIQESPYYDVNHWRVGYGSDTITKKDGTVKSTTKNDVISLEEAELDLARRVKLIEGDIQEKIGAATWNNLSANTKAALSSVAYNYGSLPKNVASAAKMGDKDTIAMAIENLASHNNGINSKRRREEAALARS